MHSRKFCQMSQQLEQTALMAIMMLMLKLNAKGSDKIVSYGKIKSNRELKIHLQIRLFFQLKKKHSFLRSYGNLLKKKILTWGHFFVTFFRERGMGGEEREREREKEGERDINVRETLISCLLVHALTGDQTATWVCALTRNWTCDLSVYGTVLQTPKPHWPGFEIYVLILVNFVGSKL